MSGAALTIKLGGTAGAHAASLAVLIERVEQGWVIVHGGGDEVGDWSRRLGVVPATIDGLRVTDPATLEIAVAVLRGIVNTRLVAAFVSAGIQAIGLSGVDADLLGAERFDPRLGEVGRIRRVNAPLLATLAAAGRIPVIAPIARGDGTQLLNVNADEVAGAIAAVRGGKLLLLTDVPGVMQDGELATTLTPEQAEVMLADETASGGMRPKLRAALVAAGAGCDVSIVDGTDPAAVQAALDGLATGTTMTAASAAGIG